VAAVVPDSPAHEAGLRSDDIVVRLGHERVATAEDLARGMRDPSVTSVRLSVVRGGQSLILTVRLMR
jgi:S1-C subfamily serine protease